MAEVSIEALTKLGAEVGGRIRLVQGAGGNLSLKNGNEFWIKASGTWLADAERRPIFVLLDLRSARARLAAGSEDFSDCVLGPGTLRPSIETSMHLVLPQPVVVHVHSINAISWAVRRTGRAEVADRLEGLPWGWVDYCRPGLPLSTAIRKLLAGEPGRSVLVLANHGLVVTGDTVDAARALLSDVESRLTVPARPAPLTTGGEEGLKLACPSGSRLPRNRAVHSLAYGAQTRALTRGALYPDHAVFLGTSLPILSRPERDDIAAALARPPHCVLISDVGVLLGEECSAGAEAMLEGLALLLPTLPERDQLRFLNDSELGELLNWEAEDWRKALASRGEAG